VGTVPDFNDRERTLILTALWNYRTGLGQIHGAGPDVERMGPAAMAIFDEISAVVEKLGGDPAAQYFQR
jgi:hypothetical protein